MSNENRDFYLKAALMIVMVFAAIYFQATTGNLPDWILSAVVGITAFILGLTAKPPQ